MNTFDLVEYQEQAITTAIYKNELAPAYPLIGIVNEAGELAEAVADRNLTEVLKEGGDVLWYLALAARDLGMALPRAFGTDPGTSSQTPEQVMLRLCAAAGELAGHVKKSLRDDDKLWHSSRNHAAETLVLRTLDLLASVLSSHGLTLQEVAAANLAKLASRAERGVLNGSGGSR